MLRTNKQIRIRIPKNAHQQPVIYHLISDYGLIVNIKSALLLNNSAADGWFNLDLEGTDGQIQNGLTYLHQSKLDIWIASNFLEVWTKIYKGEPEKITINQENSCKKQNLVLGVAMSKRIRVRIPQNYYQEPVISRLVSDYGLTVNIKAAILGGNAVGDGWFDLDLEGTEAQIQNGLTYLQELKLEIWDENSTGNW